MTYSPFRPSGPTVNIDASAASQAVQVSAGGHRQIRMVNNGTETAWIAFGAANVAVALGTGFPLPAGAIEVMSVNDTHAAVIAAAETGAVYFTPGDGI